MLSYNKLSWRVPPTCSNVGYVEVVHSNPEISNQSHVLNQVNSTDNQGGIQSVHKIDGENNKGRGDKFYCQP